MGVRPNVYLELGLNILLGTLSLLSLAVSVRLWSFYLEEGVKISWLKLKVVQEIL